MLAMKGFLSFEQRSKRSPAQYPQRISHGKPEMKEWAIV